ncbi:DNA polymerase V [Intrasporangium oryzae NRRL B-24470]|uniref:DNA polymerase V n=1 Tax=Intrasporangium oryzae NRRL B-24470 TaxID=1386089 RepID=W9GD00_9MICO|nr:DNA recombination protein RmuC [Intrasporangium oryzae]EWT03092.1 DNA polymerase V [Intrasporangium oryzae NRRL B-24470]
MDTTSLLIGLLVGVALGAVVAWLGARSSLLAGLAGAEAERDVLRDRVADLERARDDDDATAALLAPLRDTIGRVERQVGALERDRVQQFGQIGERLTAVSRSTESLRSETATLASALNASTVRGTWGEVQLRRVLELSGLLARCDFDEQVTRVSRHGATVRPDAVINLPGSRHVVVDSKAPMSHFLQAHGDTVSDVERGELLAAHATALRRHVESLAAKAYWTAFTRSPEVVVCFVPGEAILAAALSDDPGLYEHALSRKVVLASPGTLFAVLRTVGAIWQQDALEQNARELLAIGQDLYARLGSLGGHVSAMGQSLSRSVENYNRFVGTLESRVLVTARRMHDLELVTEEPPSLDPIEVGPRALSAPELTGSALSAPDPRTSDGLPEAADLAAGSGAGVRDAAYLEREVDRQRRSRGSGVGEASA